MSQLRTICRLGVACLAAVIAGCQSSESFESSTGDVTSVAAPPTTEEPESGSSVPEAAAAEVSNKSTDSMATVPFTPPFPDRTELFEPPKRAASNVRRDEEHGDSVELKGFVNVDQPRAVLSIDGVISPVAEGGEKYGVQVISIQPPSVVLQRGRSRWTATLE
jgi:hypothetical protein